MPIAPPSSLSEQEQRLLSRVSVRDFNIRFGGCNVEMSVGAALDLLDELDPAHDTGLGENLWSRITVRLRGVAETLS